MAEWTGIINATAPKYLKGAADQTIRKRLVLRLLRENGRIQMNESSYQCTWDLEYSQPDVRQYGDAGDQTFSAHDALRQLTLDWRGYTVTDRMTKKQELMNKGIYAIVNLYDTKIQRMTKALTDTFGGEIYVDGNASGNENRLHGLESFLDDDNATVAGDKVARPSDTYAGRSTQLGAISGSWTSALGTGNFPNATIATDWPSGTGDVEYDFMSPKLINWSSTAWKTGGTTFEENCERAMRQTVIWLTTTGGKEGRPTCFLLSSDLFGDFQNFQAARNRVVVPHKEAQDLGFADALNFDGVMVKYEYNCPPNTGYALNVNEMQLSSLDSVLFRPDGPEWDIESKSYLFELGFFGNMRFNPKHFAKLYNYA